MKHRKKNKATVCRMIKKSSEKAIKNASNKGQDDVVTEIERQRDEALQRNDC